MITSKVVCPKNEGLVGDLALRDLADSLLLEDMDDIVIISIGHPVKLSEKTAAEEFSLSLRLTDSKRVFCLSLGSFKHLIGSQPVWQVSKARV